MKDVNNILFTIALRNVAPSRLQIPERRLSKYFWFYVHTSIFFGVVRSEILSTLDKEIILACFLINIYKRQAFCSISMEYDD